MRPKAEVPLVRRTLILHERERHRLDALRTNTEAASDSEIVREALIYYEQLYDDDRGGRELIIRDAEGKDFIIPMEGEEAEHPQEGSLVKRNLLLHEKSAQRLDALRRFTGAPSDSQLVRNALLVYEQLVNNALAGKHFIVRDRRTGHEREYFMPVSPQRRPYQILNRLRLG